VDGEFQRYAVESGDYIRNHFFGPDERLRQMVSHLDDDALRNLPRGGHDYRKLYAAYKAATENLGSGRPTVILCKTVKGWTLGEGFEGRNATHSIKKMTKNQLLEMRDRLQLHDQVPDDLDENNPPYIKLPTDSIEYQYMVERRSGLGGPIPKRTTVARRPMGLPDSSVYDEMRMGSKGQEVSTTMGFTRLLRNLTRDDNIGERIVPIVPDEARTFGMDSLFREIEIYASQGQKYEPVDHDLLLSYAESSKGQFLEEGITEAGAMSSFIAAGTAYATRGVPMVPFYTFYSMFGFQRTGDLIWQAADMRTRGFLMGATAGRTTLLGEGLQHQDGHSLVLASTVPAVQAYDPAFAYEIGAIVEAGIKRMYGGGTPEETDVFYYITLYNETYEMPTLPDRPGIAEAIVEGLYKWRDAPEISADAGALAATILFSGTAQGAARDAAAALAEHYGVAAELWSATSYKALREEGLAAERQNRLHPSQEARVPRVAQILAESSGPITAVSDFMMAVPEQILRFLPDRTFMCLGTDGMGRSDTREALRRHFEVDAAHVVVGVLSSLLQDGKVEASVVEDAIKRYDIDPDAADPFII
jgi:pyruvate dehydrogenase E1 component